MDALLDPFQLPFMERAAWEIALLAPLAGIVGAQIVLRRFAFYAHAVGTATFPGLVIAGPAGLPPAVAALGVAAVFGGLWSRLGRTARAGQDAVTALLLVACLALGIVLASDVFGSGSEVDQLLFGSLLAIGDQELVVSAIALAAVALAWIALRRTWIAGGFDPGSSGVLGLRSGIADWVLVVAIGVSVVSALDAVGALLVSAILVIPACTARLFARSVWSLELGSALLALGEGLAGLRLAYELDVPPGAAIAVLAGGVFALALGLAALRRGNLVGAT